MQKVRLYIKVTNYEECDKATNVLKQLGFVKGNFISTKCKGWVYGDDDGIIKFLMQGVDSYPAVHAKFRDYDVLYPFQLTQTIIDNFKRRLCVRLMTSPIVTKKEYRSTIEILNEVRDHITKYEYDKELINHYNSVIKNLEKYYVA